MSFTQKNGCSSCREKPKVPARSLLQYDPGVGQGPTQALCPVAAWMRFVPIEGGPRKPLISHASDKISTNLARPLIPREINLRDQGSEVQALSPRPILCVRRFHTRKPRAIPSASRPPLRPRSGQALRSYRGAPTCLVAPARLERHRGERVLTWQTPPDHTVLPS